MTKPSKNFKSVSQPSAETATQHDYAIPGDSVRVDWDGNSIYNYSAPSIGHVQDTYVMVRVEQYTLGIGNTRTDRDFSYQCLNYPQAAYSDSPWPISYLQWSRDPVVLSTQNNQLYVVDDYQNKTPVSNVTLSPDYSVGYIRVLPADMQTVEASRSTLDRFALFEFRYWPQRHVIIYMNRGDGQYAKPNDMFETPLSVRLTDGPGSMEATHNALVWFTITTPDLAEFDLTGDNQRYMRVMSSTDVGVWCKNGIATAPRIKAKAVGDVYIRGACNLAQPDVYMFVLHITEDDDVASSPWFCDPSRNDHQDVIVGNTFPANLVAKVQTQTHLPATTGEVKFDIYASPVQDETANVSFAGGPEAIVPVDAGGGYATATGMIAKASLYGKAGYAIGNVFAYPKTYRPQDPRTDTSGRVATFTLRVWSGRVAAMSIEQGDKQQQSAGLTFDQRLKVKVLGQDGTSVANLAVTFNLTTGPAEFIFGDTVPLLSWTPTSVVVATDNDGYATAPQIRATANQTGSITVTASSAVSNSPSFSLYSSIPLGAAVGLQKENGDLQDQHINEFFQFPLAVLAQGQSGPAQTGQVTFTCVADAAAGAYVADVTNPAKQSTTSVANVSDGSAVAPDALMATSVTNAKQNYGYFTVTATSPYSSLAATFKERVWRDKNATLTAQGNTNPSDNETLEGYPFRSPVSVLATDPSGNPLNDLLVTFTITGSATFRYDDLSGHQGGPTAAMVYTRNGIATSPDIIAGDNHGTVTITADATVAVKPVDFQLEVLESATAPNFTYVMSGDIQDQTTNGSYSMPLVVSAKTINGQAATTGDVYWEIVPDSATASFTGVSGYKTTSSVTNGIATSPTIVAGKMVDDDHGTLTVYAYPTSYTGNPLDDDIKNQVSAFTLRVWPPNAIDLVPGSDNQKASTGQDFDDPLTVAIQDKNLDGAPVTDYLVTFKVTNGPATFDPDDSEAAVVSLSSDYKTAVVRSNFMGIASSPLLKAGTVGGAVTVLVSDFMGNHATYNNLTVVDPAPKLYALTSLVPDGTLAVPANTSNTASFKLKTPATAGGPTATTAGIAIKFVLQNDSRSQASFSAFDSVNETTAKTGADSVVSVKVYGGGTAGNSYLYASQAQAQPDDTIPVSVQVYSS